MPLQKVKMRVNAFFGDDEIELWFPENWELAECHMASHDKPAMTDDEMRQALASPYGTPRLRDMAKGKKEVCIVFDDLPKPTPTDRVVPFVLEELHAVGINDEQIRFLCGPGTHRPLIYAEFAAKLGREVVEKYLVFNHSVWENVVFKGNTSRGTPVWVNREFDSCDLRLAIGSLFPHGAAGFGGGGKIILPGICGMETIAHHHSNPALKENSVRGRVDDNLFRLDIEEAARLAGLQFKIDVVLNNHRQVVGLFAGDLVEEHRAGVKMAWEVYGTQPISNADVLVLNSYPDEPQMGRALWPVASSLNDGGDVVVVNHSHEGQNLHQLSGRFGKRYGGRRYDPDRLYQNLKKASRIIVMAPHLSKYDREMAGPPDKVVWYKTWAEVLAALVGRHGPGTRVGVYPYAALQLPVPVREPAAVAQD